jgi:hypothetical protein
MAVKVVVNLVPSEVTEVTMTTATRPAISPYSRAVTPRSSFASALRLFRNVRTFSLLVAVARRPSGLTARIRLKSSPGFLAGRLTVRLPLGAVLRWSSLVINQVRKAASFDWGL